MSDPVDVSQDAGIIVSDQLTGGGYGTPDLNTANDVVSAGWANAQALADSARDTATQLIQQLEHAASKVTGQLPSLSATVTAMKDTASALDTFEAKALALVAPAFTFSGVEAGEKDYTAPEFVNLRAALNAFVGNSLFAIGTVTPVTGIDAGVENALWSRGRARSHTAQAARAVEATAALTILGMPKPSDALAFDLAEAGQAATAAGATYERDVAVKQSQMQQDTFHFAFEQSADLYQMLVSYARDRLQRGLQAARAKLEAATRGFGGQVEAFVDDGEYHAAFLNAGVAQDRAIVDARTAQANIRVDTARENVRLLIQEATAFAHSVRGAASLAAQLAAASLSSVNISASSHGANSWALSVHDGRSRSISASIGASTDNSYSYTP